MRIRSSLTVEARHGTFGSRRWMELLAAIGSEASIAAAARHVGLSYKAAWDAVEAMNNLADAPLVERIGFFIAVLIPVTLITFYTIVKSKRLSDFLEAISDQRLPASAKLRSLLDVWKG